MKPELTRQIVVRVTDDMYQALAEDAAGNGRSIAQSVRFHLRHLINHQEHRP